MNIECEKNKNKQQVAGIGRFFKQLHTEPISWGKSRVQELLHFEMKQFDWMLQVTR